MAQRLCATMGEYLNTRGLLNKFNLEVLQLDVFSGAGSTAQGFAGEVLLGNGMGIMVRAVFKVAKTVDWTITLEDYISRDMCSILPICPYFTCGYGTVELAIPEDNRDFLAWYFGEEKPFRNSRENARQNVLVRDVLFMQEAKGEACASYFTKRSTDGISHDVLMQQLYSVTMQLFSALELAQEITGFSHNDLHSNNIMVVPTAENELVLFRTFSKFSGGYVYRLTPTNGLIPIVIDYGFSYTSESLGRPWYGAPDHENWDRTGSYALGPNQIADLYKAGFALGGIAERFLHGITKPETNAQRNALSELFNMTRQSGLDDNGWFQDPTHSVVISSIIARETGLEVPDALDLIKVLIPFPTNSQQQPLPAPMEELRNILDYIAALGRLPGANEGMIRDLLKQFFRGVANDNVVDSMRQALSMAGLQASIHEESLLSLSNNAQAIAAWISSILPPLIQQKMDYYTHLQMSGPGVIANITNCLDSLQSGVFLPDGIKQITVFDQEQSKAFSFSVSAAKYAEIRNSVNPIETVLEMYRESLQSAQAKTCGIDVSGEIAGAVETATFPQCYSGTSGKIECSFAQADTA